MWTESYDEGRFTCTYFPELGDALEEKLKDGLTNLKSLVVNRVGLLSEYAVFIVEIEFNSPPAVYDWHKGYVEGSLYLNADGGGVHGPLSISIKTLPKADSVLAAFRFELCLDSRVSPIEQHTAETVLNGIDYFIVRANVGYCYHFPS